MGARPWERAARASEGVTKNQTKTQGFTTVRARTNVLAGHHAPAQRLSAAAGQHEKIPGTSIKKLKGGTSVRVVHASGKEFTPNDVQGVWGHLEKLQRTGQAAPEQWQPTKKGGQGQQKSQVKPSTVSKFGAASVAGRFATSSKVKSQRAVPQKAQQKGPSPAVASGRLSFTPPQLSGSGAGLKFWSASKVSPTAKVGATFVKKKILKTISKPKSKANSRSSQSEGARHMPQTEQEKRILVNNTYFTGKVISCGNTHAWVLPQRPSIPSRVLPQLQKMNDEFRAANKADTNWSSSWRPFCNGISDNVVYVAHADIEEGLKLSDGISVRFKLYTDSKGVGGCEVGSP